jgi:hypothetical protein
MQSLSDFYMLNLNIRKNILVIITVSENIDRGKSLSVFIEHINQHVANIPLDAMMRGILTMPWIDLLDEFEKLERHERWLDQAIL